MPLMAPPATILTPDALLQFHWLDPTGTLRNYTKSASPNLFVKAGSQGLGFASFNVEVDKLPRSAGAIINKINTESRKLNMPIVVHHSTFADLILSAEDVFDHFDTGNETENNPGYWRITRPDGTVRQILAYYLEGLEGDSSEGAPNWTQYIVSFLCLDPWPTEVSDTVVPAKTVAQAAVFNQLNQGKLLAYPRWKVTGPVNNIQFNNQTTSKVLRIDGLGHLAGTSLFVDTRLSDTRPGHSVYDTGGNNRLYKVVPNLNSFWTLAPGTNNIEVTFPGGGTSAATTVELTYLARYRSLFR